VSGDSRGRWDGARVQQLVRNLVSNAIRYGSPDTTIRVALRGEEAEVRVEVTNSGLTIELSTLSQLFHPLKRGAVHGGSHDAWGGLGLGLFIVREIARAHGGEVEARSDEGETTFAVRLPRHHRAASA
jgi:signal transduction histidine kinase